MIPKTIRSLLLGILSLLPILQIFSQIEPGRLSDQIVPSFQRIELNLNPEQDQYDGKVEIQIHVKQKTNAILFHGEKLEISNVDIQKGDKTLTLAHRSVDHGMIEASSKDELLPGEYTLSVNFSNDFNTNGLGLFKFEEEGEHYTCTQFETIYARQAFPCWDEPSFKIPFQLTLRIPATHQAFANTPDIDMKTEENEKIIVFQKTKPIPSYLIAFATGPYEIIPMPGCSVPSHIITTKGKAHLTTEPVKQIPKILNSLEAYFKESYPFEKMDFISIPEFSMGAMENPGLLIYTANDLLQDSALATFTDKSSQASVHAHELSHMWYGNKVTMKWWDDLWLNEAFASWMGYKITDRVYPEYRYKIRFAQSGLYAMQTDALPSSKPIIRPMPADIDPIEGFDVLAYQKGRAIVAMTESWIGEKEFQKAIVDYIQKFAWKNANSEDLWTSFENTLGKDIKTVMEGFVQQAGVPLIRIQALGVNKIRIQQERFASLGMSYSSNPIWTIPIGLVYSDGDQNYRQTIILDRNSAEFQLLNQKPLIWLYPNANATGYYRFWMEKEQLLNLATKSEALLSLPEKVALINNMSALLDAGSIAGDVYLDAIQCFSNDSEPEVIEAIISALHKMKNTFIITENKGNFANYVKNLLQPALERFGLQKKQGEIPTTAALRPQLIMVLGDYGEDEKILKTAEKISEQYERSPEEVDPAIVDPAIVLAAIVGDSVRFENFKKQFIGAKTPSDLWRYASALGSFRDEKILEQSLDFSLSKEVSPNYLWPILENISFQKDKHEILLNWFIEHYIEIGKKCPPFYIPFFLSFFKTSTIEQVDKLKSFVLDPSRKNSFIEQEMNLVYDQALLSHKLREKEKDNINQYLKRK